MAREPDPADWDGEPPVVSGGDGEFEWSVAGYVRTGDTYEDFHNFDPDSEDRDKQLYPLEDFPSDWEFLGRADFVVIKAVDPNGNLSYARVYGPFADWDDFARAVDDWWDTEY